MEGIGKGPWTMKCPVCDLDMVTEEVEVPGPNIMIDHCIECKGIWLDKGELRSILQNRAPERAIERTPGLAKWGKQVCPRCKGTMKIKFIKDIEVDECSECKGIWLDNGELGHLGDKDIGPLGDGRIRNILRSLRDGIRKRL